jgi:hypothetical protein
MKLNALSVAQMRDMIGQRNGAEFVDAPICDAYQFVALCNKTASPAIAVLEDESGERCMKTVRGKLCEEQQAALGHCLHFIGEYFKAATRDLVRSQCPIEVSDD